MEHLQYARHRPWYLRLYWSSHLLHAHTHAHTHAYMHARRLIPIFTNEQNWGRRREPPFPRPHSWWMSAFQLSSALTAKPLLHSIASSKPEKNTACFAVLPRTSWEPLPSWPPATPGLRGSLWEPAELDSELCWLQAEVKGWTFRPTQL